MSPAIRRAALTAHVSSSVAWLGAVVGSLALAIVGLVSEDVERVRAVYLTLEVLGWAVLVPLSVASLVTGLVQSLGSRWGLLRHYWVLIKLLMNVTATVVLLMYTQTLSYLAGVAARSSNLATLQSPSAVVHSSAALALLLVATTLSVYKPRGLTRYGQRKQLALAS